MESLTLDHFRGFKKFSMEGLRPVNLLVGTNNSGKTSVLEAIQLLCAEGDPSALRQTMTRRGEQFFGANEDSGHVSQELDVRHLFFERALEQGSKCVVTSHGDGDDRWISYEVKKSIEGDFHEDSQNLLFENEDENDDLGSLIGERLVVEVAGSSIPTAVRFPLSHKGGLSLRSSPMRFRVEAGMGPRIREANAPVRFLGTESFSPGYLRSQWDDIVLTQQEQFVIKALEILEPVERIAFLGVDRAYYRGTSHGGVLVKISGMDSPVPIGSMGEGMWRLLVLAICVVRSAGGTLLVDEIDTGLHHTVIADMWKLVVTTAKQLDVQIFATTHSLDCVRSLAAVIRNEEIPADSVCIQRVEKETQQSVRYSDREIVIASERDTEVR